jgi:hypothetical protein
MTKDTKQGRHTMSNARNADSRPHGFADRRTDDGRTDDQQPDDRLPDGRDRTAATAVLRRLDGLDERIWAAAHATDDAQLAVQAAREFANDVFLGIVVGAGSGRHRLNCLVSGPEPATSPEAMPMVVMTEALAVALPADRSDNVICELIALAHVTDSPAVVVLRTAALEGPDVDAADDFSVRGWRIAGHRCEPLDAAGIFAISCSEAVAPLPIHPGTHYEDAYPLVRIPQADGDDGNDDDLVTV